MIVTGCGVSHRSRCWITSTLCAAMAAFALLNSSAIVLAQEAGTSSIATANRSQEVATALKNVAAGKFNAGDISLLTEEKVVRAIPAIEELLKQTQNPLDRGTLATDLIRLGDSREANWNIVMSEVDEAINTTAPELAAEDADGNIIPGKLSPAFVQWAADHALTLSEAIFDQTIRAQGAIVNLLLLKDTQDQRIIPALRRALTSRNYGVAMAAANGLATLKDMDSIPLIISACGHASKSGARSIAYALVFFDDIRARHAAEEYLPRNELQQLLRARALNPKVVPFAP
jgi:hypothetical protein